MFDLLKHRLDKKQKATDYSVMLCDKRTRPDYFLNILFFLPLFAINKLFCFFFQITQLKINCNPFAKGFRDAVRWTDYERYLFIFFYCQIIFFHKLSQIVIFYYGFQELYNYLTINR